LGGQKSRVVIIVAGREDVIDREDYERALIKPPYEDLPWRRTELPPLPEGAPDDFDADRGSDAKINKINAPDLGVNIKDRSGHLIIEWERRLRTAERRRYAQGADTPSWLEEFERIYADDIVAVAKALREADPKDEAALSNALQGFTIIRNDATDRK
jgi:hypothetical protein